MIDKGNKNILIPLINKTVRAISEKEINAVLNTSNKAAKLIDTYMKDIAIFLLKTPTNVVGGLWNEISKRQNQKKIMLMRQLFEDVAIPIK